MKNTRWLQCTLVWVIVIIFTTSLPVTYYKPCKPHRPYRLSPIEALKAQLRANPRTLLIDLYYSIIDPPNLLDLRETLAELALQYKAEVGLTLLVQEPKPLNATSSASLYEIRAAVLAVDPLAGNNLILFVSNGTQTSFVETILVATEQRIGKWRKESPEKKRFYGLCDKGQKVIGDYDFNLQCSVRNDGGNIVAIDCLKHEIGHYFGLNHNEWQVESVMYYHADRTHGKWTEWDLQCLLQERLKSTEF